ncbi:MAG: N-acetylmuramoyl-L-alanine amidase [Solobacterium sp.]|nr:N-acetylmuramoyl-L-alanine amidase [Solobacterium sp.]
MTKGKKKLKLKDPMILILTCLFLFITLGTGLKAYFQGGRTEIRIELDAAYGESAKGNTGVINEADYNAALVRAIEEELKQDNRFVVKLTHKEGEAASIADRAEVIEKDSPDLVLSIHCGYSPAKDSSVMKVYAQTPDQKNREESLKAAEAIAKAFEGSAPQLLCLYYEQIADNTFQIVTRDAKDTEKTELKTWALMEQAKAPVVIVEQFNVANAAAAETMNSEQGLKETAKLYKQALLALYGLN